MPYSPMNTHSFIALLFSVSGKGLRMIVRASWRSEVRRVGRRPCKSRRRMQRRSEGTSLIASDLHNARATILNPFRNIECRMIKEIGRNKTSFGTDIPLH